MNTTESQPVNTPMLPRIIRLYDRVRLLGVASHELAHASAVKLAGGEITDMDLTAEVRHKGDYSVFEQIGISYAPLVVNTLLAVVLSVAAMRLPQTSIPDQIIGAVGVPIPAVVPTVLLQAVALGMAYIFAAAALPSLEDAKSPYQTFKHRVTHPTLTRLLSAPFAVLPLVVFVLPLGFAYARAKSHGLRYVTEAAFALFVVVQATGTLVLVDAAMLREAVHAVLGAV